MPVMLTTRSWPPGYPRRPRRSGTSAWLLFGWALMLTAMMAPLLIPALRHVRARSLRSRRWRAMGLVTLAHVAVWTAGGIVLLAVASLLRSVSGHGEVAVLLGLVAALSWQLSPLKQHCLNRHCARPPISSFGRAADHDALRFGGTHAAWCFGSCWALMLVPLLAPAWHLAVMLVVSVWMWVEPLDRPAAAGLAGPPPAALPAHRRRDGPLPAPACRHPCGHLHGPGRNGRAQRAGRWSRSVQSSSPQNSDVPPNWMVATLTRTVPTKRSTAEKRKFSGSAPTIPPTCSRADFAAPAVDSASTAA